MLGRVATAAARLLQGKHKATYTPFIDTGDHVVIVNAAKVKLTGRKEDQKIYRAALRLRGRPARGARQDRAPAAAGAPRRRSRARHAAEDHAGRRDVPEAQGLRRRGSSARGAETHFARGRVTWQQFSTTRPDAARRPPPACSCVPASGAITVNHREFAEFFPTESLRIAVKHAAAAHRNRREVRRARARWPAAASPARPAPCASASRARCASSTSSCAGAEEGRPPHARRARQGTQEVRAGRSAQAVPVQQAVGDRWTEDA